MIELYKHQSDGVRFLSERKSAMLCDEMGCGKSRQALVAAQRLYREGKIDRVLILAPAAVRISWRDEMSKLIDAGEYFPVLEYIAKNQSIRQCAGTGSGLPVLLVSYALLPQKRHVEALESWCASGKTLLVCDESSFIKNRTAKQTKSSARISAACSVRWLLTGTPIANSPLDLYGQAMVMEPANGNGHNWKGFTKGPLKGFGNWYHFQARYAVLKQMNMGQIRFKQVVGYQNIDELTKRFAPYVLRRTKQECLDLPAKSYTVREVALSEATWKIYQELKREALLALPDEDVRPEPNAAVRILRLCQLTSGHVGTILGADQIAFDNEADDRGAGDHGWQSVRDVSSEKLSWLVDALLDGELSTVRSTIVWCRWRRERERLHQLLATKINVYSLFGGQQEKNRSQNVADFINERGRGVLLAQPHAGGYGLNLAVASTAVYMSNDFSYTTRIQSEDRCHRIGQKNAVTYVDVLAVSPKGGKTIDHYILEALKAKRSLADTTCNAWRRALND